MLSATELRDGGHVNEEQSLSLIDKCVCGLSGDLRRGVLESFKAPQQRVGQRTAGARIRLCDRHMPYSWIIDQEPVR
jgi:hypothetical protein